MRQSAYLVVNPMTVSNFACPLNCMPVGPASASMMAPIQSYFFFQLVGAGAFLFVAWPSGVQLLVLVCPSVPVVLFDTQGISRHRFLPNPHLCFIRVFICDLFVSRDVPLKPTRGPNN